ncbi:type IV toxin-antitoxin system AbiEi family antitoxin [Pseudomonas aeruginosa]|uniref:type IV toxin-antitoxin system AbiEi family antitoxin n=1 Tax=Pseudomonas aeruginosa TaxID=287 RepID=UPI00115E000E|nr:type IV toxin-antitoxin system AbiEi family antitoxin [Pseudomonas aeruginosa]TRM39133.1 hypothetical protein FNL72_02860 [Pseudomonas aeruginosa]
MSYGITMHESLLAKFGSAMREATGASLSRIRLKSVPQEPEPDATAILETPDDGEWPLIFSMKKTVHPRDVREAAWHLDDHKKRLTRPDDAVLVLLAEHLSSGAREELKLRGISHFDLNGTLYMKHRRWLINIEVPPTAKRPKSRKIDLYRGARESVVHAVLQKQNKWFSGLEIVDSSQTSGYSVSIVLQELERLGWVQSQGAGRHRLRRLIAPGKLLDAWASDWTKRRQQRTRWYVWCQDPKQLLEEVSSIVVERGLPCTFTGAIVTNRLTPLLTHIDSATLIVPSDTKAIAEAMGLKTVEKGSNVDLIERSGASQLFQERLSTGAWFASPFIQYLDLLDGRGRNAELAAQLRRDILKI